MNLLSPRQEKDNLDVIVKMLNDHDGHNKAWVNKDYGVEDAEKLRRIVRAWTKAQEELRRRNLHSSGRYRFLNPTMGLSKSDWASLERSAKGHNINVNPDGSLSLVFSGRRNDRAAQRFFNLLGSSQRTQNLLGGPCDYCGDWYIRREARSNNHWCPLPKKCAVNGRKAKERDNNEKDIVEDINEAVLDWESLKDDSRLHWRGWKAYVMYKTEVSPKMLTLLIKRGSVRVPEGEENATRQD